MQKTLIIVVFGTLLLLCIGGQVISLNRSSLHAKYSQMDLQNSN